MQQEVRMQRRYFFFSFAAAFLILSILFLFLMVTTHPHTAPPPISNEVTQSQQVYVPDAQDSLSVLFIGTDRAGVEAGTFLLARFDPVSGQIPLAVFPAKTLVEHNGRTEQLADVYRYGGSDHARKALARTLEVDIDRYVRMDKDTFITCAGLIGSVEFELPQDLHLERDEGEYTLSAGRQLLDGAKLADILTHPGYANGDADQMRILGEVGAEIVNQRIDVVQSTMLDKIFERVINLVDSDISYPDFHDRKDAAVFLSQLGKAPSFALEVNGELAEEGFRLSDTGIARLRQYF